jgi:hypothetical protein
MSDSMLPRVVIRKGGNGSSIQVNFRISSVSLQSPQLQRKILELADDWTSFAIATLQFVPSMANAGFFYLDMHVAEEMFLFLKGASISQEETLDPETGEQIYSYIIHEDDLNHVAKNMETTSQMIRAARAVNRSAIGLLMAEFDYFMLRFLEICSEIKPEKFFNSTDKFTIGEISSCGSIEDFVRTQKQKTIAEKLRESHAKVIEWVFSEFELEAKGTFKSTETFRTFVETCQRRHILMHNGGLINDLYLKNCKEAGIKEDDLGRHGDLVEVDQKYIKRATARVYLTGYFMTHMIFQKSFPDSRQDAYKNLLSSSHSFLESGFTKMAWRVCEFAEFSKEKFSNELKLKFAVNKALCWLFDTSLSVDEQNFKAGAVLDQYDWSLTTPIFELALACIRRDFTNILVLAKSAADYGLPYTDAKTWVVFREAREIDGFLSFFPRAPLQIAGPTAT